MSNQYNYHLPLYLITLLFLIINTAANATNISGHITQDDTLRLAGSPYVVTADVTVDSAVTLVIEAGVEINLAARDRDLKIYGTLIAEGTVQNSIRFYSSGGGNLGGSIEFLPGSTGNSMSYVEITQHRPYSIYNNARDCAVWIQEAEVSINHCEFVGNNKDVRSTVTSVSGFGSENDLTRIYLAGGTIASSTIWPNADTDGFEYFFTGDITVVTGQTLTIDYGVNINMGARDRDLKINGTLIAEGTVQDSISFYSTGAGNLGGSIEFLAGSTGSSMRYVEITQHRPYSIYNNGRDCAVWIEDAEVNINHCEFVNNKDVRSNIASVSGFGSENDLNLIYLSADSLDVNTTWPNADTDGFQYIFTGDVVVKQGNTLTIAPGVTINMASRSRDLKIIGTLLAEGTVQDSISFYSTENIGLGGSIEFLPGSTGSSMEYVEIRQHRPYSIYNNSRDCAVWIQDAEVNINHCEFVSNNKDIRSTLTSLSGLGSENDLNLIYLAAGTVDTDAIWPNADTDGFNYVFTGDVTVAAGNTLTIAPGVAINMASRGRDLKINGTLIAEGTVQDSIRFYSTENIGLGGSIEFLPGSTGSSMRYVEITQHLPYSIYNNGRDCAVWIENADVNINHCEFVNNNKDVRSTLTSLSGFGSENDLSRIYLATGTVDTDAIWPNADSNGFEYISYRYRYRPTLFRGFRFCL